MVCFVYIGLNYWLGELNLGEIIAHIILLRRTWQFFKQVIASVGLCLHVTQNMAQSHFRVIVTTQNSLRLTWTQGWCMLILCEGSGWGSMESWELVKILIVS